MPPPSRRAESERARSEQRRQREWASKRERKRGPRTRRGTATVRALRTYTTVAANRHRAAPRTRPWFARANAARWQACDSANVTVRALGRRRARVPARGEAEQANTRRESSARSVAQFRCRITRQRRRDSAPGGSWLGGECRESRSALSPKSNAIDLSRERDHGPKERPCCDC